jgi:pimeloyl-ACP methyl ester carboxylesterase
MTRAPAVSERSPGASAPTVIALHSSGASGGQWRAYAQSLPACVTLHAPDLLGYASDAAWPADAPLRLDDEASRLAPLLRGAAQPVHLVGHSYGGAVALQVALRWPQLVRSLTLFEPVRFGLLRHGAAPEWREICRVGTQVGDRVLAGALARAAERFVDYWDVAGSFAALPATARQRVVQRMGKVRAEFEALFADPMSAADFTALRVPLRLLMGTRSPAPAQRATEVLASACPGAALVRLPGAGHLAPMHEPARVLPWLPFAGPSSWPLAA